jgi:hypothetical protein
MPETLATAPVDRLPHHAHVVPTEGDSFRLAEAAKRKGVVKPNVDSGRVCRRIVDEIRQTS